MEPRDRAQQRRFRTQLFIAGVLLLIVAAGFWSFRRLDPRVEGEWKFTVTHNASPDAARRREIDFQPDGWVRTSYANATPVPNVANGRWWVEGNQVVLLLSSRNAFQRMWADLQVHVLRILGRPEPWDFDRYEIVEIGANQMRLRFVPHPGQQREPADWVLTRSTESQNRR